ncbi:MAG: hypothetical protein HeimC3_19800 [Candidatus Heimdallarchaeota archaeon LC_3]|nr:MAG: hypothetical protein HeimC3_19800 [Candidatus Heimdallarchaeota archaeon LC_3]
MKQIFHPVDPKQFLEYEKHEHYFEKRVFLYSDRKPLQKEVSWAGKNYKLGEPIKYDAPGNVSQLTQAIYRLPLTYEGEQILSTEANGFLFIYSRTTSVSSQNKDMKGTGVSTSQIHFLVYPLKKF